MAASMPDYQWATAADQRVVMSSAAAGPVPRRPATTGAATTGTSGTASNVGLVRPAEAGTRGAAACERPVEPHADLRFCIPSAHDPRSQRHRAASRSASTRAASGGLMERQFARGSALLSLYECQASGWTSSPTADQEDAVRPALLLRGRSSASREPRPRECPCGVPEAAELDGRTHATPVSAMTRKPII
jgi:hypothetical protein